MYLFSGFRTPVASSPHVPSALGIGWGERHCPREAFLPLGHLDMFQIQMLGETIAPGGGLTLNLCPNKLRARLTPTLHRPEKGAAYFNRELITVFAPRPLGK